MVGRFTVLVIKIIELELIEHSSCLNPHISMLFIIWKSYDKMRFYFLIAAECLISFVSRTVLLFFSAERKQLIFGKPCTTGTLRPRQTQTWRGRFPGPVSDPQAQFFNDDLISNEATLYFNPVLLKSTESPNWGTELDYSWRPPRFDHFLLNSKQTVIAGHLQKAFLS